MKKAMLVVFAAGFAAMTCYGAPSVYYVETWTGNDAGWNETGTGSGAYDGVVGNGPGSYSTTFPVQGVPAPQSSTVFADAGSSGGNFVGNYQQLLNETPVGSWQIRFDFYAEDYVPSSLDFYFYSSTSGNTWTYNLSVPAGTGSWDAYQMTMVHSGAWSLNGGPAGSSAQFATDLSDVDNIGFQVLRNASLAQQDFNVDNFSIAFLIPEPETYLALGFVLVALGIAFRRRLNESLQLARAALKS